MTKHAHETNPVPAKPAKQQVQKNQKPSPERALSILPIAPDTFSSEKDFSVWLWSHTPIILGQLFSSLKDCHPNEKTRVLHELFRTCISFKPSPEEKVSQNSGLSDLIAAYQNAPKEEVK